MATPAYITYYLGDEPLNERAFQSEKKGSSLVIAFKHAVLFSGYELYTMNPLREHQPFIFTKILDKSSVVLYEYMTSGKSIDKIVVDWYQHNPKSQKDEIYFQHTLEKAKIVSITLLMPNVKDKQYDTNVHAEEVALRYDSIKWFCPEGHIESSDIWAYSLALRGLKKKKWKERTQETQNVGDDFADWFAEQNKPKAKKIFKVHIIDPEESGITKVKVTLKTGDEYFTDDSGNITIEKDASAPDTIEIVEITLPEQAATPVSVTPVTPVTPATPVQPLVPPIPAVPPTPTPSSNKSITMTFVDNNGNKLKGVKITTDTGKSFVSDTSGIVLIKDESGCAENIKIVSMELAA
jgi:type VI secretion system secreted protein Hcp